jgi:hypothetical protein
MRIQNPQDIAAAVGAAGHKSGVGPVLLSCFQIGIRSPSLTKNEGPEASFSQLGPYEIHFRL